MLKSRKKHLNKQRKSMPTFGTKNNRPKPPKPKFRRKPPVPASIQTGTNKRATSQSNSNPNTPNAPFTPSIANKHPLTKRRGHSFGSERETSYTNSSYNYHPKLVLHTISRENILSTNNNNANNINSNNNNNNNIHSNIDESENNEKSISVVLADYDVQNGNNRKSKRLHKFKLTNYYNNTNNNSFNNQHRFNLSESIHENKSYQTNLRRNNSNNSNKSNNSNNNTNNIRSNSNIISHSNNNNNNKLSNMERRELLNWLESMKLKKFRDEVLFYGKVYTFQQLCTISDNELENYLKSDKFRNMGWFEKKRLKDGIKRARNKYEIKTALQININDSKLNNSEYVTRVKPKSMSIADPFRDHNRTNLKNVTKLYKTVEELSRECSKNSKNVTNLTVGFNIYAIYMSKYWFIV